LEGLDAYEVLFSRLIDANEVLRIDAEYFGKTAVAVVERLRSIGAVPLISLASITDGIHTSLPFIEDGDVKVLSAKHPKENFIDASHFETISAGFHAANPRTALREQDVLISTVGTIGNSAVVTPNLLPANSDRHIGIIRLLDASVSPYLLSTFLLGRYGKTQSIRETTGNVQPNLFISKIGRLLVPKFSDGFAAVIAANVENGYRLREMSVKQIELAERALLVALGLENWRSPESLHYVRSSRDAFAAGRLDAEHFQPKFEALAQHIESTGRAAALGTLLTLNRRGKQPDYADIGLPVVNSKQVLFGEVRIDVDNRYASVDAQSLLIEPGDVLLNGTGVGTIGRSAPYLHELKAIPDNHVTILRPKTGLDPVYLSIFLNSLAGQLQVAQRLRGSSGQIELYPSDIAQFCVWNAPEVVQSRIRKAVDEGFQHKQHASQLFETAKRAVEIAIENSEESAIAYLATQRVAP
jgi:type I restriction enzyme M protein